MHALSRAAHSSGMLHCWSLTWLLATRAQIIFVRVYTADALLDMLVEVRACAPCCWHAAMAASLRNDPAG